MTPNVHRRKVCIKVMIVICNASLDARRRQLRNVRSLPCWFFTRLYFSIYSLFYFWPANKDTERGKEKLSNSTMVTNGFNIFVVLFLSILAEHWKLVSARAQTVRSSEHSRFVLLTRVWDALVEDSLRVALKAAQWPASWISWVLFFLLSFWPSFDPRRTGKPTLQAKASRNGWEKKW